MPLFVYRLPDARLVVLPSRHLGYEMSDDHVHLTDVEVTTTYRGQEGLRARVDGYCIYDGKDSGDAN
jgi:hypothetical protein